MALNLVLTGVKYEFAALGNRPSHLTGGAVDSRMLCLPSMPVIEEVTHLQWWFVDHWLSLVRWVQCQVPLLLFALLRAEAPLS
jgi:hypothetical protein